MLSPYQVEASSITKQSPIKIFRRNHPYIMSLAAFRKSQQHEDLAKLAEEHFQHDLDESDRDVLKKSARTVSVHAAVGSLVGLGLGVYIAYRLRKARLDVFNAFRAVEKPTHVVFAGGRTEPIPNITPLLQPTRWGDFAAYFFFSLGGLFVGGETGLLTGTSGAARSIRRDPGREKKIENAYRRFRVDALRKEADRLENGAPVWE